MGNENGTMDRTIRRFVGNLEREKPGRAREGGRAFVNNGNGHIRN